MKSLIENYVEKLSSEELKTFALKNDINLNEYELNYILNLVKDNWKDILNDDAKYLDMLQNNISKENFSKIKKLFLYYKDRYKGYLF